MTCRTLERTVKLSVLKKNNKKPVLDLIKIDEIDTKKIEKTFLHQPSWIFP
jgi:hypothetical protein